MEQYIKGSLVKVKFKAMDSLSMQISASTKEMCVKEKCTERGN